MFYLFWLLTHPFKPLATSHCLSMLINEQPMYGFEKAMFEQA